MDKTKIFGLVMVVGLIVGAIGVFAFGGFGERGPMGMDLGSHKVMMGNMKGGHGAMHEQMEEVFEDGNYQSLVALREEIGFNIMPWVENQEDFEKMKAHHEEMEEMHEKNGGGCGMMH